MHAAPTDSAATAVTCKRETWQASRRLHSSLHALLKGYALPTHPRQSETLFMQHLHAGQGLAYLQMTVPKNLNCQRITMNLLVLSRIYVPACIWICSCVTFRGARAGGGVLGDEVRLHPAMFCFHAKHSRAETIIILMLWTCLRFCFGS